MPHHPSSVNAAAKYDVLSIARPHDCPAKTYLERPSYALGEEHPAWRMAAFQNDVLPPLDTLSEAVKIPSAVEIGQDNQALKAAKDLLFGSTAGVLAKYVEYPFDTVKVRLQSQNNRPGAHRLNGPLDAFAAAFRAPEGPIRSLYRGISAPLVGAAVETSSLFFSYRVAQDLLVHTNPAWRKERDTNNGKVELPFSALLACGAASGAFTSLLLTPIELVKCKMQVPIQTTIGTKLPGPLQILATVCRNHGILGLWQGQMGTFIRETGGSAAWFGSYEGVKLLFLKFDKSLQSAEDIKVHQQLLAGAAAGVSYNFLFFPADTIKSRIQTADSGLGRPQAGFMAVSRDLWAQQGIKGFYRGCGITVARSAPSSAIIFGLYEGLKAYFG